MPDTQFLATAHAIDHFIAEVIGREPWKGLADFTPEELDELRDAATRAAARPEAMEGRELRADRHRYTRLGRDMLA